MGGKQALPGAPGLPGERGRELQRTPAAPPLARRPAWPQGRRVHRQAGGSGALALPGVPQVLDKHGDPQLTQYVEDMLQDQVGQLSRCWWTGRRRSSAGQLHLQACMHTGRRRWSAPACAQGAPAELHPHCTTSLHRIVLQAEDIKKAADYVAQLRRVGKGYGA